MSGGYHVQAQPGTSQNPGVTIVALPPSRQTGIVPFGRCNVSLTSDFVGATVRMAVGSPGQFRVFDGIRVDRGHDHLRLGADGAGAVAGRISRSTPRTIFPLEPFDEVLSIVHGGVDFNGEPGGQPVGVLLLFESTFKSFAYHAQAMPNSTTVVSLVATSPPNTRTFVSLATDFEPARVRFAIGREGSFRVFNEGEDVIVPVGRKFVVEAQDNDEIVSVVHRGGMPVSVLVECGAFD